MGTEKRERKKANRAERRASEQRSQRRQAVQRRVIRIGSVLVLGILGVILIAWLGGAFRGDSEDTATSDDATATTVADLEPTQCPPADGVDTPVRDFAGPPPFCIDLEATYQAELVTNFGELTIDLDPSLAPETVNNFVVLARYGYYDDTICHRIIGDFVVQCGDPTGTGTGGPGYSLSDELPESGQYQLGSVAMANSGPDTQGSQFFIITGDQGVALPPLYSLFGEVTAGRDTTVTAMNAVGSPAGTPTEEVRIARVRIVEN